jgi:hypothetical protein
MNIFNKARELFKQKEDQEPLRQLESQVEELNALTRIMDTKDGEVLINWLKSEIKATIDNIIKTREDKYISDLDSNLKLFNKLTSSKEDLKAIEAWLSEEVNKYVQE